MKRWIALLLLAALCLSLAACAGVKAEDVTGYAWVGMWTEGSASVSRSFRLEEDGSYLGLATRNSVITAMDGGRWEISGNKIVLYPSGSSQSAAFEYRNGKLYQDGREYTKE